MRLYVIQDFEDNGTGDGYVVKFMLDGELFATSNSMTLARSRELVDKINALLGISPEKLETMIDEDERAWFVKEAKR